MDYHERLGPAAEEGRYVACSLGHVDRRAVCVGVEARLHAVGSAIVERDWPVEASQLPDAAAHAKTVVRVRLGVERLGRDGPWFVTLPTSVPEGIDGGLLDGVFAATFERRDQAVGLHVLSYAGDGPAQIMAACLATSAACWAETGEPVRWLEAEAAGDPSLAGWRLRPVA